MFIPRLEMRKEFVWAGAEKPKSEIQAREGVAFVTRMLDCDPKTNEKVEISEVRNVGSVNSRL
jgi:hypothetical protein